MSDALRGLPKVDRVARHPLLDAARGRLGSAAVTELARRAVADAREAARGGSAVAGLDEVAAAAAERARSWSAQRTRPVINATGVVLHTNLGRAPLSAAAVEALARTAGRYASLEIDLETGRRGGRAAFAERALAQLAGTEAALVVNNNAAAVLLALGALAAGRGVLVSRGELVEIGGGFRIPEVLACSGAKVIEVGTTNRTRDSDYARALDDAPDAAAILRVHPGNFRQEGFVERPGLGSLTALARARGVLLIEDLGGGLVVELGAPELRGEPLVRASLEAGVDLVCFSTDKALGGPQGGAAVGSRSLVDRLRRHPLARALRLGRLPLVALEATLDAILRGAVDEVPALAALRQGRAEVLARASRWAAHLAAHGVSAAVVDVDAMAGGGTFAEEGLGSAGVALAGPADALLARLRSGDPAVVARIVGDRVVVDARTVLPDEDHALLGAIVRAAATGLP